MSLFGKLFRGVAATASVVLSANFAPAQESGSLPPAVANLPGLTADNPIQPVTGFGRTRAVPPNCAPCYPATPCPPGTPYPHSAPGMPPATPPQPPTMPSGMPDPMTPTAAPNLPDFGDLGRGAGVGPVVAQGGYIENAVPTTMFRLRYDSAYNNNRPDRGNFFYAKCGCFRPLRQFDAEGPPLPERSVDYQELTSSVEYAFTERMSAFFDIPVRFINPDVNQNAAGISDIGFGGKYAFLYTPQRVASLFLRFSAPAGSLSRGLGNGTWFAEPGILYLEQVSRAWQLFGEFRFQFPLGLRTDFTGNLLRYGLGSSYVVADGCWGYVAPVVEVVGWTVLSGKQLDPDLGDAVGAAGDTIVNAKFGVRVGFGRPNIGTAYPTRSDLYIGYGRALTGEVWYKDMLRIEFRRFF